MQRTDFIHYIGVSIFLERELNLINLQHFPFPIGEQRNIIMLVAHQYQCLGTLLLNDESGAQVEAIHMSTQNPEDAMYVIFRTWVRKDVNRSWGKLIECLKKSKLGKLAGEIEAALGLNKVPVDVRGNGNAQCHSMINF